jgi:hypothetical protein
VAQHFISPWRVGASGFLAARRRRLDKRAKVESWFCKKSGNKVHFFQRSHDEGITIAVAKRADLSVMPPADEYVYSFRAHCCSFQIQTKNDIGNEYPHRVKPGNQRIIRQFRCVWLP